MSYRVICGDVTEVVSGMEPGSFDGCLCDPPYGLGFMGKKWDHGVPSAEVWAEVLRVLKPGAHLLAFGGTRTFHRLACAIEDAGFEIRDCVSWLYGSGFPKSHNFGGALTGWSGFGTALKPAWEPCLVAMKPLDGTFAENALRHGVAGINVEAGRIARNEECRMMTPSQANIDNPSEKCRQGGRREAVLELKPSGRWPANLIHDGSDEVVGLFPESVSRPVNPENLGKSGSGEKRGLFNNGSIVQSGYYDKETSAARFFYCAKASRKERDGGLDGFEVGKLKGMNASPRPGHGEVRCESYHRNTHPCLKPLDLNRYLASLILPPPRDTPRTMLVPFSGSGSEMIGGLLAGWDRVVGIEREADYCAIAEARLKHNCSQPLFR